MTQAPFYWNMNPAPGYNAAADPAYASALEKYRNQDLQDSEAAAEALVAKKQQNLTTNQGNINSSFDTTFNPGFYDNYAKSLMDYWQPDLDRQYGDANRQLNYTFAESQPGGGSAPAEAFGRLKEAYNKAELSANDNSRAQANQLRGNVEGQRSALLASVNGDTDPNAAIAQTTNTIGTIPLAPTYSPLGDAFSSLTAQYANAAQAGRNGGPGWGFATPTSSGSLSGSGSQKVYN